MERVVYSFKVANELMANGIKPIRIEKNTKYPQFNVWIFENTVDFNVLFAKLTKK